MARESRETWSKRIERWRESGLTAKEFAAEIGVNAGTLAHWKYRLSAEAHRAPIQTGSSGEAVRFVEVQAAAATDKPTSSAPSVFEVVLTGGTVVRVPAHFDTATLRRLLDVMTTR